MGMMLRRHKRQVVPTAEEPKVVETPKKAPVKRKKADDNGKD